MIKDPNVYSSHCLSYISYFCLEFNIFSELSSTSSLVPRPPSPGKCDNKIQDFPEPVRTLFSNSKRCCIDRLIFRSKQNCESLTDLASHCDDRLFRIGKVQVTAKNPFQSCKLKLFRNAENFIDIGSVQKLSVYYMRQCYDMCERSSKFSASFLRICRTISPTFCAVIGTFLLEYKNMASNWPGCIYGVRRRETTPSLAAL